jgi:hypothetical protein
MQAVAIKISLANRVDSCMLVVFNEEKGCQFRSSALLPLT